MRLRDAVKEGLASQQREQDIYEVAILSSMPINRKSWSITKHAISDPSGNGQIIYQGDQLDDVIDFADSHLGLDPNSWDAR